MRLGEWVKKYREEHGLSMQSMADICGFSKAYIGMLEGGINPTTGKQLSPKIETFSKIARGAGISLDALLGMLDDVQPITVGNGLISESGRCGVERRVAKGKPLPIFGSIACGVPIPAQTDIQGVVVPDKKIRATFALRAKGDSMINVGIADGDVVFVREQAQVEEGEIAAVYIDGEATLKKFYRHGDAVELRPANDSMRSMYFSAENCSEFRILGKCVGYMHGFE